jgi:hypothetical protein
MRVDEQSLNNYLSFWMSEKSFEELLSSKSTQIDDVIHVNNPFGEHQTVVVCQNELILLFPPIE